MPDDNSENALYEHKQKMINFYKDRGSKFFVIKIDDFLTSLDPHQAIVFNEMLRSHEQWREAKGKKKGNDYIVVNQDESYAQKVKIVIKKALNGKDWFDDVN